MNIQLHDKIFKPLINEVEIQEAVISMASKIDNDYITKPPIILPVLDGAFVFAAALTNRLECNAEFSFIKYKSYHNTQSSGKVNQLLGLDIDIKDKDILIVEDIIDTGLTISYLLEELKKYQPKSVKVATLLSKPDAIKVPLQIDYNGIEIPNSFIVGYGMDYNGLGRNLNEIYVVEEQEEPFFLPILPHAGFSKEGNLALNPIKNKI